MLIARVIGRAIATVKHPFAGRSASAAGQPVRSLTVDPVLVIDTLGAGEGQLVLISSDGKGAREQVGDPHFAGALDGPGPGGARGRAAAGIVGGDRLSRQLVTVKTITAQLRELGRVELRSDALITPAARDRLQSSGLQVTWLDPRAG
jgi:ethanolamine utilization protein EutN